MLKDKLSFFSKRIQHELFSLLDETFQDPLLASHQKVLATLEIIQVEKYIFDDSQFFCGRPKKSRINIARAFLAKHILNICTTAHLIHMLKIDKNLRYICGWFPGEKIPSEATFSRAFAEFSETKVLERIHEYLVKDTFEGHAIVHCARDSVPLPVRERDNKGEFSRKERYSQKDNKGKKITVCEYQALSTTSLEEMVSVLPKHCCIGKKTKPDGLSYFWRGYKLHVDIAEGRFPVSCLITSASTHDSQAAIPLSKQTSSRATVFYELMDSAYDVSAIKDYIKTNNRVPLIKLHKRKGKRKELIESNEKSSSVLKWKSAHEKRLEHRFCNERIFARLKDSFLGHVIRVRNHCKVMCHAMLGILSLFASELLSIAP